MFQKVILDWENDQNKEKKQTCYEKWSSSNVKTTQYNKFVLESSYFYPFCKEIYKQDYKQPFQLNVVGTAVI